MNTAPHVVIVGAGPVGLALGLALSSVRVTMIDRQETWAPVGLALDSRVYAVAPRHLQRLRTLGVEFDLARSADVLAMQVEIAGAKLLLEAPAQTGRLATILENAHIIERCADRLVAKTGVEWRMGTRLAAIRRDGSRWTIRLSDGGSLTADLLVGADGMHSDVRQLAGIPTYGKSYGQSAIVAHYTTTIAHGGVARQWFNDAGTLAWLPLPHASEGARMSMVWSVADETVPALLAQDDIAFAQRVQQAGHSVLGDLTLMSKPLAFPLSFAESDQADADGVVLIGDAAHTVHPLAGQGLNLGLGDAFGLADAIEHRGLRTLGEVLPGYRRSRRLEWTSIQVTTDLLARYAHHQTLAPLLAWGVRGLDAFAPLKQALAELAGATR